MSWIISGAQTNRSTKLRKGRRVADIDKKDILFICAMGGAVIGFSLILAGACMYWDWVLEVRSFEFGFVTQKFLDYYSIHKTESEICVAIGLLFCVVSGVIFHKMRKNAT